MDYKKKILEAENRFKNKKSNTKKSYSFHKEMFERTLRGIQKIHGGTVSFKDAEKLIAQARKNIDVFKVLHHYHENLLKGFNSNFYFQNGILAKAIFKMDEKGEAFFYRVGPNGRHEKIKWGDIEVKKLRESPKNSFDEKLSNLQQEAVKTPQDENEVFYLKIYNTQIKNLLSSFEKILENDERILAGTTEFAGLITEDEPWLIKDLAKEKLDNILHKFDPSTVSGSPLLYNSLQKIKDMMRGTVNNLDSLKDKIYEESTGKIIDIKEIMENLEEKIRNESREKIKNVEEKILRKR